MENELTRSTVDPKYTWDVTRIFESDEAWEAAFAQLKEMSDAIAAKAGTLAGGKEAVLSCLRMEDEMGGILSCIYTYAMMKQNEDTTVGKYQAMLGRAATLYSEVSAQCAFVTPELLARVTTVIFTNVKFRDVLEKRIRYDKLKAGDIARLMMKDEYFHKSRSEDECKSLAHSVIDYVAKNNRWKKVGYTGKSHDINYLNVFDLFLLTLEDLLVMNRKVLQNSLQQHLEMQR